jgi:hypothetical protein
MSSKQKYCNLFTFVKKNNKDLFALIDDLCAESLFKQKYPFTFLNPNKDVVKKLEKLIDNGEQELALEKLKSLFIYGKHDTLSKDLISYNKKKLTDLAELSKLKKSSNFNQWEGKDTLSVFELTHSDFPKEDSEIQKPPISKKGKNEHNLRVKHTHELMENYLHSENLKPVIYAVNSMLKCIKGKDMNTYNKIKLLVDPSPIVSWYILVQPTKTSNKHISDDLFNEWHNSCAQHILPETGELHELFNSNDYENKKLKEVVMKRKSIKEVGLEDTIKEIQEAYNNDHLKMLEDELRFRFSDEEELDREHVVELNLVDWDNPKSSLILLNRLPKSNILRSEIMNIIKEFLKTNAFLYTPYNKSVVDKLKSTISGAGSGDSPVLRLMGEKNKDNILNLTAEVDLHSLVKSLSKSQKEELASLLDELD